MRSVVRRYSLTALKVLYNVALSIRSHSNVTRVGGHIHTYVVKASGAVQCLAKGNFDTAYGEAWDQTRNRLDNWATRFTS